MSESLKEWKVAITSVGQGYESIEEYHDYKTGTGMTYRGQEQPMDIGKSFQRQEAQVLQLQQIQTHSKGMLSKEERTRD